MKKRILKKSFILLVLLGVASFNMNAQDQNFTGGLNGWGVAYGAVGPVSHDATGGVKGDGALVLTRVNNNSNFGLGTSAGIDATTNKYIKIVYKNETLATDLRVQGSQTSNTTGAGALPLSNTVLSITPSSPGNGVWETAYIDMSSTTNWSGTVQNLDILIRKKYAAGEGNFYLDEISFVSSNINYDGFVQSPSFEDATGLSIYTGTKSFVTRDIETSANAKDGINNLRFTYTAPATGGYFTFSSYAKDYGVNYPVGTTVQVKMWVKKNTASVFRMIGRVKTEETGGGAIINETGYALTSASVDTWEQLTFDIPITTATGKFTLWIGVDHNASGTTDPTTGDIIRIDKITSAVFPVSTCTTASDVSALVISNNGATQLDLSWTDATCFDEVLVVAKDGAAVTTTPSGDGTAYTANAAFATAGTDAGLVAGTEYAVFKGAGNSVSVTGLAASSDYHFTVFTRKGTTWSAGVVGNKVTGAVGPATIVSHPGVSGADDGTTMNWEDATSWIGSTVPTSIDNVTINGKMLINSDVTTNNITLVDKDGSNNDPLVGPTVSLKVFPGKSLTVNGIATTKNNIFAVSDATTSASTIYNGTITGQIQYYKYVKATPNNDLIAFPTLENMGNDGTFDGFMDNGNNDPRIYKNPVDVSVRLFGPFDNSGGAYINYDSDIPSDLLIPTVAAKGYRIAHATGGTLRFKKNSFANTTNITIPITDESVANPTSGAWNLVGNSYPSYINFTSFYNGNKDEFDTVDNGVYGYDGGGTDGTDGTFTTYNIMNPPAGGKIAPLQGFFVKAKASTGGTLTLNPAWRETGNTDDFIAGKTPSNKALAKLNFTNGTKSNTTSIYFADNTTKGLDVGYDTGAFYAQQSKGVFTHLVEGSNGANLAIQTLPFEDYNDVSVPLNIKAEAGEQVSISLDNVASTLPSYINVYIQDAVNNTLTLLNSGDFTITPANTLSGAGRFNVVFSSSALSTETVSLNKLEIYTASKVLFVNGSLQSKANVSVFDIQGRLVLNNKLDSSINSNSLSVSNLGTGVYVVKVINGKQTETKKVIIK